MSKTLLPERRLTEEEIRNIVESDRKLFKSIKKDLNKTGEILRGLLPKTQKIKVFGKDEVLKISEFIDSYDDFCNEIMESYENKSNPEVW